MDGTIPLYLCPNCGSIFASGKENQNSCPNCGGMKALVCEHRSFADYKIIPFSKNLEEAKKMYKKKVMFNPLLSIRIKTNNYVNKINQIYIPCIRYVIKVSGTISFLGKDVNKKIYNSGYEVNSSYELLMSSLTEIDNRIISTINNYSFNDDGFFSSSLIKDGIIIGQKSNVTDEIMEKVEKHTIKMVRQDVGHTKKKLGDNNLTINIVSQEKVLVPVFYLPLKSKTNNNMFLMNGQTGKYYCYAGMDILSTVLFTLIVFVVTLLLVLLLEYCL